VSVGLILLNRATETIHVTTLNVRGFSSMNIIMISSRTFGVERHHFKLIFVSLV